MIVEGIDFELFVPFSKVATQADGSLLVEMPINDEMIDVDGEIVDHDAVKRASADYMQWAAVREMHQDSAVGTMLSLDVDDERRTVTGIARIVDKDAIEKVLSGVYKGSSMGGRKRAITMTKMAGKPVRKITDILWIETSLVDRPARPSARLTLMKRAVPDADGFYLEDGRIVHGGATVDEELSKTAEASDEAEPTEATEAAQEAAEGTDTPADPEAAPEAVGDAPEASDEAEAAPEDEAEDLEKSASAPMHMWTASEITNRLAELIECEAAEKEPEQVAKLKEALALVQEYSSLEAAELGTPDPMIMQYRAEIRDLKKTVASLEADRAALLEIRADLDALKKAAQPVELEVLEADVQSGVDPEAVAEYLVSKIVEGTPFAKMADVAAMKADLLEAIRPMQEQLAKVAAQPAAGGPFRYATDPRRFLEDTPEANQSVSEALAKVAGQVKDPAVREEIGRIAAAQDIAAAFRRPS